MSTSARRALPPQLRPLILGIGVGALAGLLVAIVLHAGHLSLGFVVWGAMVGAAGAVFGRLAGVLFRAVRGHRKDH